jgi:hypothetical protein
VGTEKPFHLEAWKRTARSPENVIKFAESIKKEKRDQAGRYQRRYDLPLLIVVVDRLNPKAVNIKRATALLQVGASLATAGKDGMTPLHCIALQTDSTPLIPEMKEWIKRGWLKKEHFHACTQEKSYKGVKEIIRFEGGYEEYHLNYDAAEVVLKAGDSPLEFAEQSRNKALLDLYRDSFNRDYKYGMYLVMNKKVPEPKAPKPPAHE